MRSVRIIKEEEPVKIKAAADRRPTALGVHIYAGGFTLGVQAAGFRVLAHMEEWPFGVETVRTNLGLPVYQGLDTWDRAVEKYKGKVVWLYGNPPCAAWSTAGHRPTKENGGKSTSDVDRCLCDPRVDCTRRLFALVPRIDPTVFTWESVAAATRAGAPFVQERSEMMVKLGFRVYQVLFDGHDTGLPQHRRRFFFVASKKRIRWEKGDKAGLTPRDAWEGLVDDGAGAKLTNPAYVGLLKRMPKNKMGKLRHFFDTENPDESKLARNPTTGNVIGRPGYLQIRIALDEVGPTIVGNTNYMHPFRNGYLTVREQAALCGWPNDYVFAGRGVAVQYQQIARAVLPPAAQWLGENVMRALKADEPAKPGITLVDFLHGGG